MPLLPVEEEGRLTDPTLRENFIERVFAYRRLVALFQPRWTPGGLVRFHTAHKMSLLSHSTTAYNDLGRRSLVPVRCRAQSCDRTTPRSSCRRCRFRQHGRRHTNVLHHMAGHLKKLVDDDSRAELAACIDEYRTGLVPLIVPLTLIRHYVRRHKVAYLDGQIYLEPHPRELMLRNHV